MPLRALAPACWGEGHLEPTAAAVADARVTEPLDLGLLGVVGRGSVALPPGFAVKTGALGEVIRGVAPVR